MKACRGARHLGPRGGTCQTLLLWRPPSRRWLTDDQKATPKPHLSKRLYTAARRTTALGVIETAPDGQLSFVPNYVLPKGSNEAQGQPSAVALLTFRPGQRVFVDATADELREQYLEPFAPEEVVALAGREGVVVGYAGCASLELVVVMIDGVPWAFMPAYLAHVQSAEGDEGQAAVTDEGVATAFDPYREPLAVGDTVQGMDGRVGCVTLAERRRLAVVFEHGSAWCGDLVWRCLFQLIRKAGERRRDGCPS